MAKKPSKPDPTNTQRALVIGVSSYPKPEDRLPAAFFPEVEIGSLDEEPVKLLRPWCDTLWQACGMERSFNFDQEGKWRERRR